MHRLRLLLEFAERGTIAATAAALGYTPSAVSQQLAALEREAGAALLDRTAPGRPSRPAAARPAGRAHAAEILAMVEAAEADLAGPEPAGRVAISAFPTAAVAFALGFLTRDRSARIRAFSLPAGARLAGGEVLLAGRRRARSTWPSSTTGPAGRGGAASRRCGSSRR